MLLHRFLSFPDLSFEAEMQFFLVSCYLFELLVADLLKSQVEVISSLSPWTLQNLKTAWVSSVEIRK